MCLLTFVTNICAVVGIYVVFRDTILPLFKKHLQKHIYVYLRDTILPLLQKHIHNYFSQVNDTIEVTITSNAPGRKITFWEMLSDDDYILFSDSDEIPNPQRLGRWFNFYKEWLKSSS